MTTFDVPEMENLRLTEFGTEVDLVEAGVTHIRGVMPEWVPRGGNTEMVLLEALAVMLGPEILSLQLLGPRVVEQIIGLYGTARSEGIAATGRAVFTVTNSNPTQVIPAGTRLRLALDSSVGSVDLFTVEDLNIITSETLTGQVDVVADSLGSLPNGAPIGSALAVVDNLPFISSATLSVAMAGGADQESDDDFFGRAASVLARQTSTLVHPEQFEYAALSRVGTSRALVLDNYDPATPGTTAYGHVTVAVAGPTGAALSAPAMEETRQDLAAQALASLSLHVIAPTYTTVNIAVTVKPLPGWSTSEVQASVTAALTAWLNPLSWGWDSTATQFEIVAAVAAAAGVREVTSAPATINLAGVAPLPTLGTVTVTVA
ncbi:baseplate J protein [Arthrobacter phage Vibaki]|uniref:Baseplate J protein n=1 Tax=Arthrobacter phage Vibaki TaxID=2593333 RepID=A0A514TYZ5_9CAUD|nr:baseplate J protein [Arthrobacter phage Vibaki]QDK01911.1 baseplate J protein [Arthrobacter phage Vibaki]